MDTAVDNLSKVDHIVVLMMENRSFDHMLGFLSADLGRNDVDGIETALFNEANGRRYDVHPAHGTKLVKAQDPCHSAHCVDKQVARGMRGFAQNYANTRTTSVHGDTPGTVMAYHTARQLPVYAFIAEHFCVCDRWFCSVPGATMPNRCYAIAGRAQGSRDNISPPLYNLHSFVRHLDHAHVSWEWYSHDDVPMLWFIDQHYALSHPGVPAYFDRQLPFGPKSFITAAVDGRLPAVSWIDPNFIDVNFGPEGSNDDHPPSDLRMGQTLVLKLVDALFRSPLWDRVLAVITYDEHGGFFDHVEPGVAEDDDVRFRRYGPRVPALVISPWVAARSCSHVLFDHTSIIKTILMRFCRDSNDKTPNMGARVANASHLGELLVGEVPAQPPEPDDYAHLVEEMSRFQAELFERAMHDTRRSAAPPELTDFQEDFLAGRQELLARRSAEAPAGQRR